MPRRGSPNSTRAVRNGQALVEALDRAESKQVLGTLVDAHPELVMEVAGAAGERLGAVTPEGVADDVTSALQSLSVEDIWERAGTHVDGSYVEPCEAGWEVVEAAVAPFLADITRRVELGRRAEATAICQGMLLGLHRASEVDGDFLEGHAPDTLEAFAAQAIGAWRKGRRGRARPGGTATSAVEPGPPPALGAA